LIYPRNSCCDNHLDYCGRCPGFHQPSQAFFCVLTTMHLPSADVGNLRMLRPTTIPMVPSNSERSQMDARALCLMCQQSSKVTLSALPRARIPRRMRARRACARTMARRQERPSTTRANLAPRSRGTDHTVHKQQPHTRSSHDVTCWAAITSLLAIHCRHINYASNATEPRRRES
jgi:hypothetical protein